MVPARLPDFFVVGAPKCGTEALRHHLTKHPDIQMPDVELHFFGSDLDFDRAPPDFARYAAYFSDGAGALMGEKSVFYLYSSKAADEIHAACPAARIIVMLRNPVDMMLSLHSYALWRGEEPITDFAAAIAAEPGRDAGRIPTPPARFRHGYRYRQLASYAQQVERYLDAFGRDAVLMIVSEHFIARPAQVYRSTLEFLDVDPRFRPAFERVNAARAVRSPRLLRATTRVGRTLSRTAKLRNLPASARRPLAKLNEAMLRANTTLAAPRPIDPALRASLIDEFSDQTDAIESLIGCELPEWRR